MGAAKAWSPILFRDLHTPLVIVPIAAIRIIGLLVV